MGVLSGASGKRRLVFGAVSFEHASTEKNASAFPLRGKAEGRTRKIFHGIYGTGIKNKTVRVYWKKVTELTRFGKE
jgi:hypothetical protein